MFYVQHGHDDGDSRLMHQCPGNKYLNELHKRGAYNDDGAVAGGRRMRACDSFCQGLRPGGGEWPRFFVG